MFVPSTHAFSDHYSSAQGLMLIQASPSTVLTSLSNCPASLATLASLYTLQAHRSLIPANCISGSFCPLSPPPGHIHNLHLFCSSFLCCTCTAMAPGVITVVWSLSYSGLTQVWWLVLEERQSRETIQLLTEKSWVLAEGTGCFLQALLESLGFSLH